MCIVCMWLFFTPSLVEALREAVAHVAAMSAAVVLAAAGWLQ